MPQNDDTPEVMPYLGAMSIADVRFYRSFFDRVEIMMNDALNFDPACKPVAVISPGLSPCIELTGLQWPSEFVVDAAPPMTEAEADTALLGVLLDHPELLGPNDDTDDEGGDPAPEPSAPAPSPDADAPAAGAVPPPQTQARAPAAGTQTKGGKAAPWTETEDQRLVEMMAAELAHGASIRLAAEHAAAVLGRPVEGTRFRIQNKLKVHIDAALADLRAAQSKSPAPAPEQTDPEPTGQVVARDSTPKAEDVAAPPADGQAGADGSKHPAPAAEPANDTPLTPLGEAMAWLEKLDAGRAKTLFTVQHDHDLLHFSNLRWPLHEIAAEIGLTVDQCKMRHSALTQMKKMRADNVLAALVMLHPELAQNAA